MASLAMNSPIVASVLVAIAVFAICRLAGWSWLELARSATGGTFSLETVGIFDVYQGAGLPEGKKSLAFSLSYRSAERTLTDDEVNVAFTKLQHLIAADGSMTVRGTSPGLNLLFAHLNRLIRRDDLNVLFMAGPGHGGPAVVANTYLEGVYSEIYPEVSQDAAGMRRLFRQFSTREHFEDMPEVRDFRWPRAYRQAFRRHRAVLQRGFVVAEVRSISR